MTHGHTNIKGYCDYHIKQLLFPKQQYTVGVCNSNTLYVFSVRWELKLYILSCVMQAAEDSPVDQLVPPFEPIHI